MPGIVSEVNDTKVSKAVPGPRGTPMVKEGDRNTEITTT